ncbi:MAG: carboxypeptidase regulatory-like domain-containing protein, partial [Gammaproteobacteria bacterium]|nr:carboxypeptidase regulatory-like domain-containing protein [Gammaproteobacteria bacterium]
MYTDNTDGLSKVYTVNYTDEFGSPNTVDVTVTLRDPNGRSLDSNIVCPPSVTAKTPCDNISYTQTNGAFGAGYLTLAMVSDNSSETVGFDFGFSKSVVMSSFTVSDIDDVGYGNQLPLEPVDSFQDTITLLASNGGANVPVTLSGGSNMTIVGQTASAIVVLGVNGNLNPTDASGTLTASTGSALLDLFSLIYRDGDTDAANEPTTNGVSNGHAVRVGSSFAFCVDEPPPQLSINKTSSANGGPVSPGDTITYTVEVNNTGAPIATNVVVGDTLPVGVTYVGGSAQKTYPLPSAPQTINFEDTSAISSFDNNCPAETSVTINVPNSFVIDDLNVGFNMNHTWKGDMNVWVASPLGTKIQLIQSVNNSNDNWDVLLDSDSANAYSTLFGNHNTAAPYYDVVGRPLNSLDAFDGQNAQGNWIISFCDDFSGDPANYNRSRLDFTYTAPGGTTTDAAGAPPNLVTAVDGIDLPSGETLTVTFDVTVDDPLSPAITELTNTASVTADSVPSPLTDDVSDLVALSAPPASVNGTIWLDVDGDGVLDIGEPGISGVSVELLDNGGNVLATTTTDANGQYHFGDLDAGDYFVQVPTSEDDAGAPLEHLIGAPGNTAGGADDIGQTGLLTLVDGQTASANLGYVPASGTGVVAGGVWSDANGDGVQGPDEIGLGDVTVNLYQDTNGDGIIGNAGDTLIATTTSKPDGSYLLTDLPAGQYAVVVDTNDTDLTGFCGATPADCNTTPTTSVPFTVAADGVVSDVDFGFDSATAYTLTDRIWNDRDGDGVFDAGESGLAGVTVNLVDDNGNLIATTTTASDGAFSFSGVPDGDYTLQVSDNAGLLNGYSETTATGGSTPITVSGSDIDNSGAPSFGYHIPNSIGGALFSDANGNGAQDSGEAGLSGLLVELRDGVCTPGVDCPTTTTDPDGSYLFDGLAPGNYTVVVPTPPAGSSNTTGNGAGESVTLAAGQSVTDADFGYQNAGLGDVSGAVFADSDQDGVQDAGEGGLAGITVALRDSTGAVVATTTTDSNGDYSFPDVPAGAYRVVVTDSGHLLDGYTATSGLDQRDLTVSDGATSEVDFGYVDSAATGQIRSGLWLDANGDGIRQAGEAPLSGVTIELYADTDGDGVRSAGDTLIGAAVTDANGQVTFNGLPAGNYLLDLDESDPQLPSNLNEVSSYGGANPNQLIPLSEGQAYQADFGYTATSGTTSFSGTVWNDANG